MFIRYSSRNGQYPTRYCCHKCLTYHYSPNLSIRQTHHSSFIQLSLHDLASFGNSIKKFRIMFSATIFFPTCIIYFCNYLFI
jgi:heterodisulfide reductase subunit A-like polyferredoxin